MKTYKHFFYDFDGMLADTYPHVTRAMADVLRESRGGEVDEEMIYDLLKVTFMHACEQMQMSDEEKAMFRVRHEAWETEPVPTLFPYVEQVLRETIARGGKCYIFTNRGETTYEYLKNLGIYDCFEDFILRARKPGAEALIEMLDAKGLDRAECVVVGDRALDVEAARLAGVDGILFDNDDRVEEHSATHVITKIEELFGFI